MAASCSLSSFHSQPSLATEPGRFIPGLWGGAGVAPGRGLVATGRSRGLACDPPPTRVC